MLEKGLSTKMKYLGCHLSASKGYEAMGKDALKIGANTFAFFTRNPRGGSAKPIDMEDINKLKIILSENNFGKLVAHAPYTLNPCSADQKVRDFAHLAFREDLERLEYLPDNYYNFHPGSHVGQGVEIGINLIAELLNEILTEEQTTIVLLETMAGKGSEVGRTFEEINAIIDKVELKSKLGVCLDTCHINDSGYDVVGDFDGVLREFDEVIGLEYLKALHVNDSKNPMGASKDRHEKIGEGHLGKKALLQVVNHPKIVGLPCILETPHDDLSGYAKEIHMLQNETSY